MSSNTLKEVVSKAFTMSVGRVFQSLIILLVKKFNLVLVLALSLYNLKPLDLVVLQLTEKDLDVVPQLSP